MKFKFLLTLILGMLLGADLLAQPGNVGTEITGSYIEHTLIDLGAFRQVRLQANTNHAAQVIQWNFIESPGDYDPVWRPYSLGPGGNEISGYNNVIDPATETASARYNGTSSGNGPGRLPAVTANNYYTFNITEQGPNNDNFMSVLETSFNPVMINSITPDPNCTNDGFLVTTAFSGALSSGEFAYLRYSIDNFATSSVLEINSATGEATIPMQSAGTTVAYYVFTSNVDLAALNAAVVANGGVAYDMLALNVNTNSGSNYSYTIPPTFSATVECVDGSGNNAARDQFFIHVSGLNSGSTYDLAATGATTLTGQNGDPSYVLGPITHSGSGNAIITLTVTDQANSGCPITAELPEKLCGYTTIAGADNVQDDLHASGYFCLNPVSAGAAVTTPGILTQAMPPTVSGGSTVASQYVYVLYADSDMSGALNSTDAVSAINQTGLFPALTNGDTYFVEALNVFNADVATFTGGSPADKAAVDALIGGNCGVSCGVATYTLSCCLSDAGDINPPGSVATQASICEGNGVGGAYAADYTAADETAPSPSGNYEYGFVMVDANGTVVSNNTDGDFDTYLAGLNVASATTYRIFGISYSTALNTPNTLAAYLATVTGDGNADDLAQIQAAEAATGSQPICLDIDGNDDAGTQVQVTINPTPELTTPGNATACSGSSESGFTFLSIPSGGVTISWASTADVGFGTSGTGSIPAFTAATGTATVTVTATNNANTSCTDVETFTVTVSETPVLTVPGNATACSGGAESGYAFSATPASGVTISWASSADVGFGTSGTGDIPAFTAATGTATVTVTATSDANGSCTDVETFTVTVSETPVLTVPGNATSCNGSSESGYSFSATPASGVTISWASSADVGFGTSGTGDIPSFTSVTGTATVTVTATSDANGSCTDVESFTVTVTENTVLTVPGNATACSGASESGYSFSSVPSSGVTISWTSSADLGFGTSGNGDIPAFTAATGTATVTVTATSSANNTCTDSKTFTVTVTETPVLTVPGNATACSGGSESGFSFSATPASGVTITWASSANVGFGTSGTGDIPAFTAATGTATVTVTATSDANGNCTDVETFTVTVTETPVLTVPANAVICDGGAESGYNFSATPVSGVTTSWTSSADVGFGTSGTGDITAFTAATGTATVTVTATSDANGSCTDVETFTVTVNPLPIVSAGAASTICSNGDVVLNGTITDNGSGVTDGVWTSTSGSPGTFDNGTGIFNTATTYTPSAVEVAAGQVTLRLTSDDPSGPCDTVFSEVTITINQVKCGTFPWDGN
ncbi:MAG: beta strand repeat-containing protein [Bacteroidia bacterium]